LLLKYSLLDATSRNAKHRVDIFKLSTVRGPCLWNFSWIRKRKGYTVCAGGICLFYAYPEECVRGILSGGIMSVVLCLGNFA